MSKDTQKQPNIYQRMHAAMSQIERVAKSATVNGKYSAVTHDMVTTEVRKPMMDNGIITSVEITNFEQNGNCTQIAISMWFINIDNPEDKYKVDSVGFGVDQQDKGPGKAMSYACKYALLKAFNIETGDDPDKDVSSEYNRQTGARKESVDPEKQSLLQKITGMVGLDSERKTKMLSYYSSKNGKKYLSLADMDLETLKHAFSYLSLESDPKEPVKQKRTPYRSRSTPYVTTGAVA